MVGALAAASAVLSVTAASGFAVVRHDNVTIVFHTAQDTADQTLRQMALKANSATGDTGFKANNMYMLKDGRTTYLAAFNVDKSGPRTFQIDADRIGSPQRGTFKELWSGQTFTARGRTSVTVPSEDAVIYRIN